MALFDKNMKLYFTLKQNLLTTIPLSPDLDPDPEFDPDQHLSKKLDTYPDPHIMNADPKNWYLYTFNYCTVQYTGTGTVLFPHFTTEGQLGPWCFIL
jgi:hypothetical protein